MRNINPIAEDGMPIDPEKKDAPVGHTPIRK